VKDRFNVKQEGGLLLRASSHDGHPFDRLRAGRWFDRRRKDWLTYIREEEKLARDVYLYLYDMWGSSIFDNISVSEQAHMDAIKTLIDRYGLDDPAEEAVWAYLTTLSCRPCTQN